MKPINVSPIISVIFQIAPQISTALANKQLTVGEAIDLAAETAHAAAREAGIENTVIAVTKPKTPDEG